MASVEKSVFCSSDFAVCPVWILGRLHFFLDKMVLSLRADKIEVYLLHVVHVNVPPTFFRFLIDKLYTLIRILQAVLRFKMLSKLGTLLKCHSGNIQPQFHCSVVHMFHNVALTSMSNRSLQK